MNGKQNRSRAQETTLRIQFAQLLLLTSILLIASGCRTAPAQPGASPTFTPRPTSTPRPAPTFELPTPDGDTLALADYAGQVILINFWASWCPPCTAEMADLEAYYQAHKDAGFVIIAINLEESPAVVADFVERQGLTFPVALDLDGRTFGEYGGRGLPTTFFLRRDGALLGYWPGVLTTEMLEERLTPIIRGED